MNRKRASELWTVIQAWAANLPIQVKIGDNKWQTYTGSSPDFQNENWRWQIKPEPVYYWMVYPTIYKQESEALYYCKMHERPTSIIQKIQEVES